jgi:hypothetical protein
MSQDFGVETLTYSGAPLLAGHGPVSVPGVLSTGDLSRGTVLGKATATGAWEQLDPNASDGSEDAAGILVDDTDASDAEEKCNVYVHGEFFDDGLTWPDDISDAEKATAVAALAALGIHVQVDPMAAAAEADATTTTTTTSTSTTTSTTTSN